MKISRILIVADYNDPSSGAVEYGFSLAKELHAKVTLFGIIDSALAIGNPDAGIFPDDALATLKADTQLWLEKIRSGVGGYTEVEILLSSGNIPSTIIDTAVTAKAGLIVIGIHSHTGLGNLFNRDISEAVVDASPVPVCIVPVHK